MNSRLPSSAVLSGIATACAVLVTSCTTPGGSTPPPTVAVAPMCSMLATVFEVNPKVDVALVSERTDPAVSHGFTRFRRLGGPIGNSTVGFTPDVYGISEAWLRNPVAPAVFRAQAHPARRPGFTDFKGAAWSINAQGANGKWSPVFAQGRAYQRNEEADIVEAGLTVPQLMPVGLSNPQMFACAGGRAEDGSARTTMLIEAMVPAAGKSGDVVFIQDVLHGDDRFVPNATGGPLRGPANPPTPRIQGPGNAVRATSVQCAMTQFEDNVSTRELHIIGIDNGTLYHSMASNFSPATDGGGFVFNRFNTISQWADVGQAMGGGFGTIVSATVLASRPTAISVLFVAQSGNRFRLFHAVRFSAGGGSWRPADDVLALSGASTNGLPDSFKVAGGMCPIFNEPTTATQNTEMVYATWNANLAISLGRVVSTPRQWPGGLQGIYSPLSNVSGLLAGTSDTSRQVTIQNLRITTRPFRDDAVPPP